MGNGEARATHLLLPARDRPSPHRMPMNAGDTAVDPGLSARFHRSYIVNRPPVRTSRYSGNNEFIFTMANNERIVSGRSYKEQIAKALQEQSV